jgi:hypothetical protein
MQKVEARPATKAGLDVPEPNTVKDMLVDPEKMKAAVKAAQATMISAQPSQ